jgi:hypothetical protein
MLAAKEGQWEKEHEELRTENIKMNEAVNVAMSECHTLRSDLEQQKAQNDII